MVGNSCEVLIMGYRKDACRRLRRIPIHPLKSLIKSRKIKQKRLAIVMGIAPTRLSQYLNGYKVMPSWMEADLHMAIDLFSEETPLESKRKIFKHFFPNVSN